MSSLWGGTSVPTSAHGMGGEGDPDHPRRLCPAGHSLCHTRGQTSWFELSLERWAGLWAGGLWSSRWALMATSALPPTPTLAPLFTLHVLCTPHPAPREHRHSALGCGRVSGTSWRVLVNTPWLRSHSRVRTSLSGLWCTAGSPDQRVNAAPHALPTSSHSELSKYPPPAIVHRF